MTEDTGKYIENVFSALTITWNYIPELKSLELYRKCLSKYYNKELMEEFEKAIEMNRVTLAKKRNKLFKIFRQCCYITLKFLKID